MGEVNNVSIKLESSMKKIGTTGVITGEKRLKEERLVTVEITEKLTDMIVDYAKKNRMTICNIRKSMEDAEEYMCRNAILEKEDPEEPNPRNAQTN